MSQHGRFEQDYLRMKVQIDKLKASGLSEEQRTIFSKLDKMIQHFEHHLFTADTLEFSILDLDVDGLIASRIQNQRFESHTFILI